METTAQQDDELEAALRSIGRDWSRLGARLKLLDHAVGTSCPRLSVRLHYPTLRDATATVHELVAVAIRYLARFCLPHSELQNLYARKDQLSVEDLHEALMPMPKKSETWPSLRSALWCGRLGMPTQNGEPPAEVLELVHAVLAATVRREPGYRQQLADLLDGTRLFQRMFHLWLASTGLAVLARNGEGVGELTPEGLSVLHMLAATRPYDVRRNRPSAATIEMLRELGLGPQDREARLEWLEQEARRWDAAFLRCDEAGRPTIVLAKRGDGPVPVLQTVWTLGFSTRNQRDGFYDWLCRHLDRWQAWGDLASKYDSTKLTHKLLAVMTEWIAERDHQAPFVTWPRLNETS